MRGICFVRAIQVPEHSAKYLTPNKLYLSVDWEDDRPSTISIIDDEGDLISASFGTHTCSHTHPYRFELVTPEQLKEEEANETN